MISGLGNFALWMSLMLSIAQYLISYKKSINHFKFNKYITSSLLFFSLVTFFSLMYCHIVSDFSLVNVYQNSHTTKPLIYKITGVWGNHEGSMLLWILVLSFFNYFISKLYKQSNSYFISKTLETQSLIIIGFLIFTIFTSNPFERMLLVETNGLGFNPILQDPALAIHPPLLYIGYVGFSSAFSFSIAALSLKKDQKIAWYSYMKPFVICSWTFLTAGITFGSIWAYYELGWGGWWFWDPVENASLMPWLIATALVHSLVVVEKRKSLQSWVLLLSILTFLLSVVGTFLVRSGILTSVHTFALDPSRGIYILIFTTLLAAYSLLLFGYKTKKSFTSDYFTFFSKEGAILVNNTIMIVVCGIVLLGTIYPLIIEALVNTKISVGEPYYNSVVVPIMIPAILIMGFGPSLSWGRNNFFNVLKKNYPSILLTLILVAVFFAIYKSYSLMGVIGITLSFWIIINNLIYLLQKVRIKKNIKNFFLISSKYSYGMIISHLGIGLLILGITGSSVWQKEKIIRMKVNNKIEIQNYLITFEKINEIVGPNYVALKGIFLVTDKNGRLIARLKPESRFYPITNNYTTETSINTNLIRDLYIVLGEGNLNKGWIVRIYLNPLVAWIWIGGFTIFFGGLVSMRYNFKNFKDQNS